MRQYVITSVSPPAESLGKLRPLEGHERDADTVGEDEKTSERRTIKVKRTPVRPSHQEVDDHMETGHLIFRAWRSHCERTVGQ